MASAAEYANWIVQNQKLKGTKEFNTVVQAYEQAKTIEAQNIERQRQYKREIKAEEIRAEQKTKPATIGEELKGAAEAGLALGTGATTGAIGGLIGTIGGLGEAALSGEFGTPAQAQKVKEAQARGFQAGTYTPRTEVGKERTRQVVEMLAPLEAFPMVAPELEAIGGLYGAMKPQVKTMAAGAGEKIKAALPERAPTMETPTDFSGLQAAERAGIDVMTSDIAQPKTFVGKWAQATGERIPIAGTGGMRKAQQEQRIQAVKNVVDEMGIEDGVDYAGAVTADMLKKRSEELTKYSNLKKEVFDGLDKAGEVPMVNTISAIDDQIAKLNQLGTEDAAKIAAKLEEFKGAIQGKPISVIEELRKDIGEAFKTPEMAAVKGRAEKSLTSIYGPLKKDMENFIVANGDRRDVTKWKVADSRLREMAGELKSNAIKGILAKGDVKPEEVNRIIFGKTPSEMNLLYRNLTPEGRQNVRMAVIQDAVKKATVDDEINPNRFITQIEKAQPQIGAFFSKQDKEAIDGLAKALKLTRRAQEATVAPPTGVQATIPIVGVALGSALGGIGGLLAGGTIGLAARIYESVAVRNALIGLKKAKGSKAENAALMRLEDAVQKEQTKKSRF